MKKRCRTHPQGVRKGLLGVTLKLSPEDKWANLAEERGGKRYRKSP